MTERAPVPCAFDLCNMHAFVRMPTATGWAALCRTHYERRIQTEADDYVQQQGLTTVAKKQAWIKAYIGTIGKPMGVRRQREPGDDDEEIPCLDCEGSR